MTPYYQDSACTIYHGDCRDWLGNLPKCFRVDAAITDPPYGIGFSEYLSHNDSPEGYEQFIWHICEQLESHIEIGWMCVFQAAKRAREWSSMFPREWRLLSCAKTFVQMHPVTGPTWATDYALIWPIGKPPQRGKGRDWKVSDTANMRFDRGHPCARPLDQMQFVVNGLSEIGQVVLDPFMGSGTTLRAAKDLGRKAIGIEIEERYCEIAAKRLAQEVFDFEERQPEITGRIQKSLATGFETRQSFF